MKPVAVALGMIAAVKGTLPMSLLIFGMAQATAAADDARVPVVACRQTVDEGERLHCFDQTSAALAVELASDKGATDSAGRTAQAREPSASEQKAQSLSPDEVVAKVERIEYPDGKPRFYLDNGQVWQSEVARTLTFTGPRKDKVSIRGSATGYQLHYNHSLFGLAVLRVDSQ